MHLSGKKRPPYSRLPGGWRSPSCLKDIDTGTAKPPGAVVLNLAWEGAALITCLFLFPARLNPKPAISSQGPQLAWE